jgi:hypothetical protein
VIATSGAVIPVERARGVTEMRGPESSTTLTITGASIEHRTTDRLLSSVDSMSSPAAHD